MAVWVCTFATPEYAGSAEVLRHTALHVGGADHVRVFGPRDTPFIRPEGTRGHGWWAWKPWCILTTLQEAGDGDVVVWCDAAMTVKGPLAPYAEAAHDVMLFKLGNHQVKDYTNKRWTKPDVLLEYPAAADVTQLTAAIQVYRKGPAALRFATRYHDLCQTDLVDDTHRRAQPDAEFVDHRHDQSLLTVLATVHGVPLKRDPSQYGLTDTLCPAVTEEPLVDHHRRRLNPVRVAVITATTGGPHLEAAIRSVQAQHLPNVWHYVVVDGPQHEAAVRAVVERYRHRIPICTMVLPHNVGAGGWCGHR